MTGPSIEPEKEPAAAEERPDEKPAAEADRDGDPFATFTEWAGPADRAGYADLSAAPDKPLRK